MAFIPVSSLSAVVVGAVAVTQGTVPWVVDGSAVTQPVSAVALPLPAGAATDDTLAQVLAEVTGTGKLLTILVSEVIESDASDLIPDTG